MRFSYRLALAFFSLLVALLAAFFIVLAGGWQLPLEQFYDFMSFSSNRWILGTVSFLVFLFALYFFFISFKTQSRNDVVLQQGALGYVEITRAALEDMIKRAVRHLREVREVKPVLRSSPQGLIVSLRVGVVSEAVIPVVSEQIQQIVRDYLEEKAGLQVRGISILVDSVSLDQKARVE